MNNSIFISYRRAGSSWSTRALHDRLGAQFGKDHVFMDVTDIGYGSDFADKIEKEIGRCDVMLAIISPQWLSAMDDEGNRRLDDPKDYVRLEIGMGLKRRIPVIPILVDGADMPQESELPDDLKALSRRNAIELRHSHFDSDIQLLLASLQETLVIQDQPDTASLESSAFFKALTTRTGLIGTLGLVVAAVLAVAFMITGDNGLPKATTTAGNGGIAIGSGASVSGDVTINQGSDPAILKIVEDTVGGLVDQLKKKDDQIQIRDGQTQQLSAAIAALARDRSRPDAPAGLKQALDNLASGDTEAAKAVFRQVLDQKSAEARAASQLAANAAMHLGALAALNDDAEAAQAYELAVELAPDDKEARDRLAQIEKKPGEFRLQGVLAEGGEPVETCFYVYDPKQDLDGKRKEVSRSCATTARFTLNAGRYYVLATTGNASTSQEFELTPGGLINTAMNLQAGQFRLQGVLAEGGEPVETCFYVYDPQQDLDGKRKEVSRSCATTARFTLNAGRYYVLATTGNASTSQEFELTPGGLINTAMNLQAGQFRLQGVLAEGGEPVETCFYVYDPKQDLDGKRKEVSRSCATTARFTLNAGRYYVLATTGNASTSQEFELTPGGLINTAMNLQAGQFRLQGVLAEGGEPVETCFYVYDPQQDLDGKRKEVSRSCATTARFTLNAGRYYVLAQSGDKRATKEFEIAPGQLVNQRMTLQ